MSNGQTAIEEKFEDNTGKGNQFQNIDKNKDNEGKK